MVGEKVDFVDVEGAIVGRCDNAGLLNPAAGFDEGPEFSAAGEAFEGCAEWNFNPRSRCVADLREQLAERAREGRFCGTARA